MPTGGRDGEGGPLGHPKFCGLVVSACWSDRIFCSCKFALTVSSSFRHSFRGREALACCGRFSTTESTPCGAGR